MLYVVCVAISKTNKLLEIKIKGDGKQNVCQRNLFHFYVSKSYKFISI